MSGNYRLEYEKAFCECTGSLIARAFGLGRHGIVILLKAIGIGAGDRVGVCGYTCLSVIEAVKVSGAIPVYLEVDKYLCIDPEMILQQKVGFLKAVILQHTFGVPGRLSELLSACEKIGAVVIEDCAHSFGCSWEGKKLGMFGSGAIYSSEWGKPYSSGLGGMLTVNSSELRDKIDAQISELVFPALRRSEVLLGFERFLYKRLGVGKARSYIQYLLSKVRQIRFFKASDIKNEEYILYPGYLRLMGDHTAKVGLKQLESWPDLMRLRRDNTQLIEDQLCRKGLPLWPRPTEADITMLRYPVLVMDKARLLRIARNEKLDILGWYSSPVNPLRGKSLLNVDYRIGSCRRSEGLIEKLVCLPTGRTLKSDRLNRMIELVCESEPIEKGICQ